MQNNLIPAIIQDSETSAVLMLGYMNEEALQCTRDSGRVTFYSRSKQRLWVKGESSGNYLTVVDIQPDCDQDALLIQVKPAGPTCHQGTTSCFANAVGSFINTLTATIRERFNSDDQNSYVRTLYHSGLARIAQKVAEEGVEVALSAVTGSTENLTNESADLLFHLLILLEAKQVNFNDLITVLKSRQRSSTCRA